MQKHKLSDLPHEHQAAIKAYAAKHGHKWKAKLADAWGLGTDTKEPDGWALRDIRNSPSLGHYWLANVKI